MEYGELAGWVLTLGISFFALALCHVFKPRR